MKLPDVLISEIDVKMKKRGAKHTDHKWSGPYRNHLRQLRLSENMTQKDIADAIGKSAIDISRLENGVIKMTEDYLRPLQDKLGWSASQLIDAVSVKNPPSNNISDAEIALTDVLKDVLQILIFHGLATPESLNRAFTSQYEDYREKNLPDAMLVMQHLQAFVTDKPHASEREVIGKLLQLRPVGSA